MTKDDLFSSLLRWNLWGREKLDASPRVILEEIESFLDYKGAVVIQGPRRAGKSTLLYMIIDKLAERYSEKQCLYINFEDYALKATNMTPILIQDMIEVYAEKVYDSSDFFLFLDEIQNVSEWHRWVRTYVDTTRKTVFVSGSSSKLMSSEIAGLLTGRHVSFEVMPFSFRELYRIHGHSDDAVYVERNRIKIKKLLEQYTRTGGFPEVALRWQEDESGAMRILSQYAEDIVLKDIAVHFNIMNMRILRFIAHYLAQNSGSKVSIRKLQRMIEGEYSEKSSTTTIANYLEYLVEAYLAIELKHFDYSIKRTFRKPSKYYICDPGLRNAMASSLTPDYGKLLENVVFLYLRSVYDELYFWSDTREVDFVGIRNRIADLYNVTYVSNLKEIDERELQAFADFPSETRVRNRYLITWDLEERITYKGVKIDALPAWKLLIKKP